MIERLQEWMQSKKKKIEYDEEDVRIFSRGLNYYTPGLEQGSIEIVSRIGLSTKDTRIKQKVIQKLGNYGATPWTDLKWKHLPGAVENLQHARYKLFEIAFRSENTDMHNLAVHELSRGLYNPDPTEQGLHHHMIVQYMALLGQIGNIDTNTEVVKALTNYMIQPVEFDPEIGHTSVPIVREYALQIQQGIVERSENTLLLEYMPHM